MNMTELESQRSDPLLAVFKDLGYWPILNGDKWQQNQFDLTELLGKIENIHSNKVLLSVSIYSDPKNTSTNILQVSNDC